MELRTYGLAGSKASETSLLKPSPLDILLAAMHARWAVGDHDAAVALAAKAAPYVHPRAPAVSPQPDMRRIPDGQLDFLCDLDSRQSGEGNPSGASDELSELG